MDEDGNDIVRQEHEHDDNKFQKLIVNKFIPSCVMIYKNYMDRMNIIFCCNHKMNVIFLQYFDDA